MSIDKFNKYAVIRIDGNISTDDETRSLEYDIEEAISEHYSIIILDFKKVKTIGSAAIAKMLEIYRNIQVSKGRLGIINVDPEVETILKSLMFFKLLKKYDSEKDIML